MNEKDKIYYRIEEKEVTPEDGVVDKRDIFPGTGDNEGLFYGYGKNVSFESNDPRLALPIIDSICSIFFIIGILIISVSILFKVYPIAIFGLIFVAFSTFAFVKSRSDIRNIAKENNIDVDFDLIHSLKTGYRFLSKILTWPIKTLIDMIFRK